MADAPGAAGLQTPPERFLKFEEVSRRVGLGKTAIYDLIRKKRFPAPYKLTRYASRWSEREILAWIKEVKDGFEGKKRKF
ncbi:helix-turn-helix transcriptional regulator [Novosphingobium rosa]|uniref:helix-turn-helix transcriptional regulator n=1 Tax=Novosphingobium rosa TaxID=76978 RepID=UPI0008308BFC|nr:AlpA family phage regulatory protein [Novosphingobium rosa]